MTKSTEYNSLLHTNLFIRVMIELNPVWKFDKCQGRFYLLSFRQ